MNFGVAAGAWHKNEKFNIARLTWRARAGHPLPSEDGFAFRNYCL